MKATFVIASALLTGCAPPGFEFMDDMKNNQFALVAAQPVPAAMVGRWTGSTGAHLTTFIWSADGTGLVCSSGFGKDVVERVKHHDARVLLQNGMHHLIVETTPEYLTIRSPYMDAQQYKLMKDAELKNASPYCAKELVAK